MPSQERGAYSGLLTSFNTHPLIHSQLRLMWIQNVPCNSLFRSSLFSPLETISTSLWASLHHFPVLSVFSHVSCRFIFVHIFPVVVDPSQSRPPPSLPRYDHVHHFLEVVFLSSPHMSILSIVSYLFTLVQPLNLLIHVRCGFSVSTHIHLPCSHFPDNHPHSAM